MSKRAWKYRGLMTKRYQYDASQKQPESSSSTFIFTRILKYGRSGEDVKELKKALAKKGYTSLTLTNGNFYGSTRNVVKAFQRDNGLTIDGVVGSRTYAALNVKFKL